MHFTNADKYVFLTEGPRNQRIIARCDRVEDAELLGKLLGVVERISPRGDLDIAEMISELFAISNQVESSPQNVVQRARALATKYMAIQNSLDEIT